MRSRLWNLLDYKKLRKRSRKDLELPFYRPRPLLPFPPLVACAPALQSRGPNILKEITPVGGLSAVSLLVSLQHLEIVHMVAWDRSASAPKKLFT